MQCLATPDYTPKIIVRDNKEPLLKRDYELLLISAMCHPSVNSAAQIAQSVSWRKIWDNALDYGVKGTRCVQSVLRELCRPTFGEKLCHQCNCQISEHCFSTHLFECHPSLLCHKSVAEVITLVSTLDMKFIMSIGSKLSRDVHPASQHYYIIIILKISFSSSHCLLVLNCAGRGRSPLK